jgi:hypothetical protein
MLAKMQPAQPHQLGNRRLLLLALLPQARLLRLALLSREPLGLSFCEPSFLSLL